MVVTIRRPGQRITAVRLAALVALPVLLLPLLYIQSDILHHYWSGIGQYQVRLGYRPCNSWAPWLAVAPSRRQPPLAK